MYKISHVKCVCFLFLVILAVLSCSGFRIDNLAMTDISRKNSHASHDADDFFQRLVAHSFQNSSEPYSQQPQHPVRHHHRQSRSHYPHEPRRFEPQRPAHPTVESYALPKRPQRSPRAARKRHGSLEQAVSWKAHLANTVVVARAESKNYVPQANCTVLFRIIERMKHPAYMVEDRVRLEFPRHDTHCVLQDFPARPNTFVKVNIKVANEYFLFLNATSGHSYSVVGTPVLVKDPTKNDKNSKKNTQIRKVIKTVTAPNFRLKKTRVELKVIPNNNRTRLKLLCQVWGFPTPYISWKVNNNSTKPNIKYRKKKSTLVVKEHLNGTYKCIARGIDETKSDEMRIPSRGEPCKRDMQIDYCGMGICFFIKELNEYGCECPDGFTGRRCQTKTSHYSTYGQTSTYTCKLGLSTKVFC